MKSGSPTINLDPTYTVPGDRSQAQSIRLPYSDSLLITIPQSIQLQNNLASSVGDPEANLQKPETDEARNIEEETKSCCCYIVWFLLCILCVHLLHQFGINEMLSVSLLAIGVFAYLCIRYLILKKVFDTGEMERR